MNMRYTLLVGCLALMIGGLSVLAQPTPTANSVSGVVVSAEGEPLGGAIVRVQVTSYVTHANALGAFTIALPDAGVYRLTAWAQGYFNAAPVEAAAGQQDVRLVLEPHANADNPGYRWLSAYSSAGDDLNCEHCHAAAPDDPAAPLPFDEWRLDAHASTVQNPRFLTVYAGTDLEGNVSPQTEYIYNRDYGKTPLPPDLSQPYYGPGYLLDFPESTGSCAACHAPLAAINAPYETNPLTLAGVHTEGVNCDFCHKVWDVALNPMDGLPYPNMPGVLSYTFRRPETGEQFFAGPFDDVAPGEDTYSPLQRESAFCAGCHYGVFWDTVIYNSFGEWLASPYSDPDTGRTCQDCHMPPGQSAFFAHPSIGGLERDPQTIFSHRMPGASDPALLQDTATMTLNITRSDEHLTLTVHVENTNAGHHLPTDSPLRQMLLVIDAHILAGEPLTLIEGTMLPNWAGDLSGLPGRYYAKLLEQMWTGVFPTGAYWTPVRIREDTRLPAFGVDSSTYVFDAAEDAAVVIEARLLLRRAYSDLMLQKDWAIPDIVMEQVTVESIP